MPASSRRVMPGAASRACSKSRGGSARPGRRSARRGPGTAGSAGPIALPDGVVRLPADGLDATALAAMAGTDVDGITYLLVAVPAAEHAIGRAAVAIAEHVVAVGPEPVPGWAPVRLRGDGRRACVERIAARRRTPEQCRSAAAASR